MVTTKIVHQELQRKGLADSLKKAEQEIRAFQEQLHDAERCKGGRSEPEERSSGQQRQASQSRDLPEDAAVHTQMLQELRDQLEAADLRVETAEKKAEAAESSRADSENQLALLSKALAAADSECKNAGYMSEASREADEAAAKPEVKLKVAQLTKVGC